MGYFILEIPGYLTLRFPRLMILRSSNLTSVIKQFNISSIFLLVRLYSIPKEFIAKYLFIK